VSQASARRSLNKPLVPGRKTPGRSKAWDRLGFGALALLAVAVLSVIVVALGGLTSSAGDAAPHVQIIGAPEALPGSTPVPAVTDAFTAPAIAWPIADLDPGLAGRGPRPTLAELSGYFGSTTVFLNRDAAAGDWRLAALDEGQIWGYPRQASVEPGQTVTLCLGGSTDRAQIRVFRMGLDDASLVASSPFLALRPAPPPSGSGVRAAWSDPVSGLYEAPCPTSYALLVGADWRSGFYLAKLTAANGAGSYAPFVVRPAAPMALLVIVPLLTDQAYNEAGGASLYRRAHHNLGRATAVSLNRPLQAGGGAGTFFISAFPLLVWLEDHGYSPGYATDLDLATHPGLATGARLVLVAGHAEYWTESMRQAVLAAEARGVGVGAFGANLAYWQIRLGPDHLGAPDRTIVCFKSSSLDPLARSDPQAATVHFNQLPHPEPAAQLFGANYVGLLRPIVVGPLFATLGLVSFAADSGLRAGQELADLAGDELDGPPVDRSSAREILGARLLLRTGLARAPHEEEAAASIWITPSGAHVFDAGTFTWAWGVDPRYAAALPGFPAAAFARLTAEILAWLGAPPGG